MHNKELVIDETIKIEVNFLFYIKYDPPNTENTPISYHVTIAA